jgi:hypothetical protein
VLLDALCAFVGVDVDGRAELFGALNRPAACAVELADTVCDEGVKLSCGSAEVDIATGRELPAVLFDDEVCVCCVDGWGWLSEPALRFTTLATDMIHLRVAAKPGRNALRCAQLASFKTRMVKGEEQSHSMPEASIEGIDMKRKNFRKKWSRRTDSVGEN